MPASRMPYWVVACWIFLASLGNLVLEAHQASPGPAGTPQGAWPIETPILRDGSRPSLLVFLHPKCPCSRASLAELARVMVRCRGRVSAKAVIFRPSDLNDDWKSSTGIEQELSDLPGLSFCYDDDGVETRRFGVETSGQVLLFNRDGQRIFAGGITRARGHEGDNLGRDLLIDRILSKANKPPNAPELDTPVFGCPIVLSNAGLERL